MPLCGYHHEVDMEHLKIPKNYESALSLHDTQVGIKTVKDFFQRLLAERLNLLRVSAPLFVDPASGMNDNLNGVERPVSFGIKEQNEYEAQVVQSLAKWKRNALKRSRTTFIPFMWISGTGKKSFPDRTAIWIR